MFKKYLFFALFFCFVNLNANNVKNTYQYKLNKDLIKTANKLIYNPMNIYYIKTLIKYMSKNDLTFYQNKEFANIFVNSISFIDKNLLAQKLKDIFLNFPPFNSYTLEELKKQERLGRLIVSDEIAKAKSQLIESLTKKDTYQSVSILMNLGKDYSKKLKKIETTADLYNTKTAKDSFYKTLFYLKTNDWKEVNKMAKEAKVVYQIYLNHKKELKIDITKIDSKYKIKDKYLKELIKNNNRNVLHTIPYKIYYVLLSSAILNNNWYKDYPKKYANIYLYFKYLVLLHQYKINQSIDYLQLLINNYPYPENKGVAYLYIDTILYAIKTNNDKEMNYIYAKTLWLFINKDLKIKKTSSIYNKVLKIYKQSAKDYMAYLSTKGDIDKIKKVAIELKNDLKYLLEDNN